MVDPRKQRGWMVSARTIREHLGGIGKKKFAALVSEGMPVWQEGRQWVGHQAEVDAWLLARGARKRGGGRDD